MQGTVHDYLLSAGSTMTASGFLLFLSGTFLIMLAAIAFSRLQFLAPNAPGPSLAGFGLFAGGILLSLGGLLQLALGRPEVAGDLPLGHGVMYLQFVCGGAGHTAVLGIGVIGFAVTCLFVNRLPRWFTIAGVVLGVVALLSSISLAVPAPAVTIPLGRFGAALWLVAASLSLPRHRGARRPAGTTGRHTENVRFAVRSRDDERGPGLRREFGDARISSRPLVPTNPADHGR